MTHVLLIDDHPIVLEGCKKLLEGAGADEIDQAGSASEGFRLYRRRKPDVIVVDLAMHAGTLNGLSFMRRLRRIDKTTPVLVLTMHRAPAIISRALEFGASGYVLKDASPEEIVLAFDMVRGGKSYLGHGLSADVARNGPEKEDDRLVSLMPRDMQILVLISEGRSYKEIASMLGVSYSTVAKTCTRLKSKLGVHTRSELIRVAIQRAPSTGSPALV